MEKLQYQIQSPIGHLYLVASEKGLRGIFWNKQNIRILKTLDQKQPVQKILHTAAVQLASYFSGQRKDFDIPLDLEGTTFQRKVWGQLSKIPYGKTVSYSDVARKIKNPKAVRAVGSANGKNPVCIVVPCHRVIAADGSIGGYAGGIRVKEQLLALEQK